MREGDPLADNPDSVAQPLARRADFDLSGAVVRPSRLLVDGPAASVRAEPRVMQVLVALADAKGKVLARDDLLRLCWDGRIVGDDAINRAIAEARRVATASGGGFEIETVPRVGFRMVAHDAAIAPDAAAPEQRPGWTRRAAAIGGAGVIGLGLVGVPAFIRLRQATVDELIAQAVPLRQSDDPAKLAQARALMERAVARDPGRADAWGKLSTMIDEPDAARAAALKAVAIDPREPEARTMLAYQQRDLNDWIYWEDALLGVLHDAPDTMLALSHLTFFYQGMGRCRDSLALNDRGAALQPFDPAIQTRRILKFWIFGNMTAGDKAADRAMQLWPRHPGVWNARLLTYAFTDRAPAALAQLEDAASRPQLSAPSIALWRAILTAIDTRKASDIDAAVSRGLTAAPLATGLAANAIMGFSHLDRVDAAYEVAAGLFERKGRIVQRRAGGSVKDFYAETSWGRTQFLFTPAMAAFRRDGRFVDLCRDTGHLAYWQRRGIWPDPFVRGSLDPGRLA